MDNDSTSEVIEVIGAAEVTAAEAGDTAGIVDELLIEEISIDGMCGVY
ncbi:MAG TPA: mycofactocin precursor MftA [Ilumatobacter sp.]|nr:mycofactocin precursor MftA [Ilumatobacter sp.]